MPLLVYNGYCKSIKAGLPQTQQCMLYLYPQLLQPRGVHICTDMYTKEAGLIPGSPFTFGLICVIRDY